MSFQFVPAIADGVLLSRHGEVHHRDIDAETTCGKPVIAGRVAPVSHVQAIVFKLGLCRGCYPDHHDRHAHPGTRTGRRTA